MTMTISSRAAAAAPPMIPAIPVEDLELVGVSEVGAVKRKYEY